MHKRLLFCIILLCFLPIVVTAQLSLDDINDILSQSNRAITADSLLLEESFSRSSAWDEINERNYDVTVEDRELLLSVTNETSVWTVGKDNYDNTIISVEATQLSREDNNGYGIMCRADDNANGDGYYFLISGGGFATIQKFEDGTWESLVEWREERDQSGTRNK